MRRYAGNFGFERVATSVGDPGVNYIAVYGSLMADLRPDDAPAVEAGMTKVGDCVIRGELYDLGDYPGLLPGKGTIHAELYAINSLDVLRPMDEFERYYAEDIPNSLFVRRLVRLVSPDVDAWVYFFNREPHGQLVPEGDWRTHLESK